MKCLLQQISGAQKKLQASQLFALLSLGCLVGAEKGLSLSMDNQKIQSYSIDAKNRLVGRGRGKLHPNQVTQCPYFLLLLQRTSFLTVHNTLLGGAEMCPGLQQNKRRMGKALILLCYCMRKLLANAKERALLLTQVIPQGISVCKV